MRERRREKEGGREGGRGNGHIYYVNSRAGVRWCQMCCVRIIIDHDLQGIGVVQFLCLHLNCRNTQHITATHCRHTCTNVMHRAYTEYLMTCTNMHARTHTHWVQCGTPSCPSSCWPYTHSRAAHRTAPAPQLEQQTHTLQSAQSATVVGWDHHGL